MCRWLPQIIQLKVAQLELEPSWPNRKSHALTHCSGCFQFVRQTWVQRILDLKLLTYITTKQILLFSQPRFTHSITILMKAFLVKPFLTKQPHTFWMKQQFEKQTNKRLKYITLTLQICFLRKGTLLRDSTKYSPSLTCGWPMKKELRDTCNNMYFIRSRCRWSLVVYYFIVFK